MIDPPMPPAKVFQTDQHRQAAAAIVATVNIAQDYPDLLDHEDQLVDLYDDVAMQLCPLDVVVAASVIVGKLIADEHVVWKVDPRRTIARMGQWVAADELAT